MPDSESGRCNQPTPPPGVEQVEEFSPEAVRVRNTAGLYVKEAFSPEAVRITNTSGLYRQEAFSPEVVRITNTSGLYQREAFSPEAVRITKTSGLYQGGFQPRGGSDEELGELPSGRELCPHRAVNHCRAACTEEAEAELRPTSSLDVIPSLPKVATHD